MNLYDRNPVQIDTPFNSFKNAVRLTQGSPLTFLCLKVRWVAPNAHDVLEVIDPASGNNLLAMTAGATGVDVEEEFVASPRIWSDWGIPQVNSGKVFVYAK